MEKAQLLEGTHISKLVRMPIYTLDAGKKIGNVKDVVYDSINNQLVALTIEEPGVFSPDRRVLFFDKIKSIGADAIMVESVDVLVSERSAGGIHRILDRQKGIIGKKILTESGNDLGNVSDILLDLATGDAVSYEVSAGFAKDIGSGRSYIEAAHATTIGEHVMIVPDVVETTLTTQEPGGLAGAYRGAVSAAGTFGESVSAYTQDQEANLSLGKTAGRDVYDDQGGLIVARGQEITDDVIMRARAEGKMHQVALAAGVGGAAAGYERARTGATSGYTSAVEAAYGKTGEQLLGKTVPRDITDSIGRVVIPRGTVITEQTLDLARSMGVMPKLAAAVLGESAKGTAASLWDETKGRFSEAWSSVSERSREAADEAGRKRAISAQKNFLKGKISATDVYDDQGNVILHEGEVITPLALDTLDRMGKLELVRLMSTGPSVEALEEEEESPEIHVVVESEAQHARHSRREKPAM